MMTQETLEIVKAVFRSSEVDPNGGMLLTGAAARRLVECGVIHPDVAYNDSPEMEDLVSLAERHPDLRVVLEDVTDPRDVDALEQWDAENDPEPPYLTTVRGSMDAEGFFRDAFWLVRSADEAAAEWVGDGTVAIYAWWD